MRIIQGNSMSCSSSSRMSCNSSTSCIPPAAVDACLLLCSGRAAPQAHPTAVMDFRSLPPYRVNGLLRCGWQDINRRYRRGWAASQARLLAVVNFHCLQCRGWATPQARLLAVVAFHNLHRLHRHRRHRHRHHRPPARLPAVVDFHRLRRLSWVATCGYGNLWLSRIVTIRSALPVCRLVLAALCASCRGSLRPWQRCSRRVSCA